MATIDATRRHYRDLLAAERVEIEDHPADQIVSAMPDIAAIDDAVRTKSTRMGASAERRRSARRWLEYEDLRFQQRALREERFFDIGYEMGCLWGIAQYEAFGVGSEVAALRRQVLSVLATSPLSRHQTAAVILEAARALLGASPNSGKDPRK